MATLQERNGSFRVLFVHHGKRHTFTLGKVTPDEAESKSAQVDYILMRLKQRLIQLPPGMDIVTFVERDGQPPEESVPERVPITVVQLRDRYLKTHRNGSLEQTTLDGIELHFKHLVTTLGEKFPIQELSLGDLQGYVDRRAKAKGIRSVRLSPATIKKEIVTLRTSWNWGVHMGLVTGKFPNKGLRYPKQEEKPPFLTWKEIEQRLGAGGLTKKQIAEYWDCLYLMPDEIAELLKFVKETASQPWVYPLFCTAAHTGARRSELLRVQVHDVDFAGETILVHEKKRAHGKLTTRRVSLSPFLKRVLKEWLDVHPGGSMLFAQQTTVARSKTKRSAPTPVTKDEAHDQFKRTLADSKWKVLKGYHCLRHSFISCLASKGIDQRIIDDFVGHQTDEQRRRYRHLFPDVKQKAIASVFGD